MRLNSIYESTRPPLNKMFQELRNSVKDYKWYTASEVNNHTWSDKEMDTFYDIIKEFVKNMLQACL